MSGGDGSVLTGMESELVPLPGGPGAETEVVVKGKTKRPLANTYAAKKTVAQGMMDVALITANANQMRFVLEHGEGSATYHVVLGLILVSLALQMVVGVSLIFKGRYDLGGDAKLEQAIRLNNYVVVGVFLITIINVFIAAFSITGEKPYTIK